jgi:hypothetical protein
MSDQIKVKFVCWQQLYKPSLSSSVWEILIINGSIRPDWICMRVVPLDRP